MNEIQKKLERIVAELFDVKTDVAVTPAPENTGADYASNIAMQLAKLVHKAPMVIAELIKAKWQEAGTDVVVEIAAPGFLNFVVNDKEVSRQIADWAQDFERNIAWKEYVGKTIVAEFSDPNPFKVLHVGHLYTSVVGDSISRLCQFAGAKVVRANFGGDVGLHVAKTLYSLLRTNRIADNGYSSSSNFASQNSAACVAQKKKQASSSFAILGGSEDALLSRGMLNTASSATPVSSNNSHSKQSNEAVEKSCNGREMVSLNSAHSQQSNGAVGNLSCISSKNTSFEDGYNERGFVSLNNSHSKQSDGTVVNECVERGSEKNGQSEDWQKRLQELTIEDIARCYVEGTRAYEEDEAAKAEITKLNKEIYRINAEDLHDSVLAQFYWRGRELSYEYFEKFYQRIGVKFDKYYPESAVADRGVREVRAHTGTTYEESEGAIVYHGEKVGLHTRVFINTQGVPTYETKDVGLLFTKWDDWHFDESIVVTGNEQSDYMKVVLASVSEYAPQLVERTSHLTHGLVKLPGNVKMSSRKGNFLRAVDVLQLVSDQLKVDAVTNRIADNGYSSSSNFASQNSAACVAQKKKQASSSFAILGGSEDALLSRGMLNTASSATPVSSNNSHSKQSNEAVEKSCNGREMVSLNSTHSKQSNETAESHSCISLEITSKDDNQNKIVLAAIKYAFLKYKMGGDIVFDPQESVSMTGNSGVYLLYATVRAQKILQKCSQEASGGKLSEEEKKYTKALNKKIIQYREVLQEAVREKAPYKVCTYLYELAQEFSRFYEHVKVAGNACEVELRQTVQAYAKVMRHGLEEILGIEVPEQM